MASTTQQQQRDPPISQTTLLTISAVTFLGSLGGSVWYVLRKDAKQAAALAAEAPISAEAYMVQHITPTTTPSEMRKASINARLFALKTLGLGTALAVGTAGIMAVAVGWWLDVHNFRELSTKFSDIIPRKLPGLHAKILRQETPADERTTLHEPDLHKLEDLSAIEFWNILREKWDKEVKERRAKFSEKPQ
ncbi:hypothetical protein BC937DRAFT_90176 [Endogone sp. FLAS-F59071]|nr:hypothetical protein BC937DRAFT_90176 [Endogone sp. FLAS-F59071]|eukprot:RUS17274.1 hypothetical protein BC937DRAFT_90176 [Endogone sp. FLAS-F59071]